MRIDIGRSPFNVTVHVLPVRNAEWREDVPTVRRLLYDAWTDLGGWESGLRLTWGDPPERPWVEMAFAWIGYDLSWRDRSPAGIACSMLSRPFTVGTDMVQRGVVIDTAHVTTPRGLSLMLAHEVKHLCGMPAFPHPDDTGSTPDPSDDWTVEMTRFGAERWYSWAGPDWKLYEEMQNDAAVSRV